MSNGRRRHLGDKGRRQQVDRDILVAGHQLVQRRLERATSSDGPCRHTRFSHHLLNRGQIRVGRRDRADIRVAGKVPQRRFSLHPYANNKIFITPASPFSVIPRFPRCPAKAPRPRDHQRKQYRFFNKSQQSGDFFNEN